MARSAAETLRLHGRAGTRGYAVAGIARPGFEPVREAFVENFERRGELGAGGSFGFADPHARIGFGYIPNRMGARLEDPRAMALLRATYRAIGEKGPHAG